MKFVLSLIFIVLFLLSFAVTGLWHEFAHQEVYKHYGIESHIYIDKWSLAVAPINLSEGCPNDTCASAQMEIDGFGYNLMGIQFLIGFGFFVMIMLMEENSIFESILSNSRLNNIKERGVSNDD
jgi:hypothetical protein